MRMMIDSLRGTQSNCYLILDSPPTPDSPDARILSDLADLIVVVAGYGQTTVDRIDDAAANFDPDKLAGVVFNNIYCPAPQDTGATMKPHRTSPSLLVAAMPVSAPLPSSAVSGHSQVGLGLARDRNGDVTGNSGFGGGHL